jgi:hypothetical protein
MLARTGQFVTRVLSDKTTREEAIKGIGSILRKVLVGA